MLCIAQICYERQLKETTSIILSLLALHFIQASCGRHVRPYAPMQRGKITESLKPKLFGQYLPQDSVLRSMQS